MTAWKMPAHDARCGVLLFALVATSTGCGLLGSGDCTSEGLPGLAIVFVDAQTNGVPSVGSRVTVTDGPYVETYPPAGLPDLPSRSLPFAIERPGRYDILVQTQGYGDWAQSGVVVERQGDCNHVKTVVLFASLHRI
jgi:hypothetical protein